MSHIDSRCGTFFAFWQNLSDLCWEKLFLAQSIIPAFGNLKRDAFETRILTDGLSAPELIGCRVLQISGRFNGGFRFYKIVGVQRWRFLHGGSHMAEGGEHGEVVGSEIR